MTNKPKLSDYAFNIYSQSGEDGIIEKIIDIIGTSTKVCVEFGAWDGFYASNTANLWSKKNWKGVLIEMGPKRYTELTNNTKKYNCVCINEAVLPSGNKTLEKILQSNNILENIDFLSIDIDGDDYHIFNSLDTIQPRIISCEYNPTIPAHIELIAEQKSYLGCSALSLNILAQKKGYTLVAITDANCIFVQRKYKDLFESYDTDFNALFSNDHITYLISEYSGDYFFSRKPTYGFRYPSTQKLITSKLYTAEIQEKKILAKISKQFLRLLSSLFNAKMIFKNSRLFTIIDFYRQQKSLHNWRNTGKAFPPLPHAYKQKVLKKFAKKYNLKTFVETGTYLGDMVWTLRYLFHKIYSVELNKALFEKSAERFRSFKNIEILNGDSGKMLSNILTKTNDPCLFWLDGHYSAGITSKGEKETPILDELNSILNHHIKDHVIIIDDARCFTGTNDYPTISELKKIIHTHDSNYNFIVKNDIIRIYK